VRGSATMKTIFSALILRELQRTGDEAAGFEFLKKLDVNTGSYVAGPEFLYQALTGGRYTLTVWNLADALLQKRNGYPFEYVIPKEAIVPVEPIALVKGGPNAAGARVFIDFVNSPEQLILMARERDRLPVRTDVPPAQLPDWMRELKLEPMKIDWTVLDKNLEKWIAKWDAEIKGKGAAGGGQ
jgi:iron(III) transport system substrate-binding protein